MREFISTILSSDKLVGLRSDKRSPRNSRFLAVARGCKLLKEGLVSESKDRDLYAKIVEVYGSDAFDRWWPYPQVFDGRKKSLVVSGTRVFELTKSTMTPVAETLYSDLAGTTTTLTSSGEPWQFADMGPVWALFNGDVVVFNHKIANLRTANIATPIVESTKMIKTGCYFKGRTILGGFNPDNIWTASSVDSTESWADVFAEFLATSPTGVSTSMPVGENYVMWSTIGGGAGDLGWLLFPSVAKAGWIGSMGHGEVDANDYEELTGTRTKRPLFMEQFERNEWGFMPMPWQGSVQAVIPMQKMVVVLGEGGVCALYPTAVGDFPTLGLLELSSVGVAGRGAAVYGNLGCVFLDKSGKLKLVAEDGKLETLGFREYFKRMPNNVPVFTYNEVDEEYYLCDEERGFVLTKHGLTETNRIASSLIRSGSDLYVMAFRVGSGLEVLTDIFDMGMRGLKTLEWVEVSASMPLGLSVAIDYRYETGRDFVRSELIPLNNEGFARVGISALEFRVQVVGLRDSEVDIDGIRVYWKGTDKRFRRGINVS